MAVHPGAAAHEFVQKGGAAGQQPFAFGGAGHALIGGLRDQRQLVQAAVIDDFVNAIQASEIFAVAEKEKTKIITQRGSPNGEYWAYPFSLTVPLRNPVTPLP